MVVLLLASFLLLPVITSSSVYASSDNEEWETAYAVGKFIYSDPPKPDQIFKIHYRVINGTTEEFNTKYKSFGGGLAMEITAFQVNSSNNGVLEIKFPRNYPYANSEDLRVGRDNNPLVIFNLSEPADHELDFTDCFFIYSIPFTGSNEIELIWTWYLQPWPFFGDDVPDSCIPETVVDDVPVRNDGTISPLHQFRAGVAAEDIVCNEEFGLVIRSDGKPYCVTPSTAVTLKELWKE